MNYQHGEKQSKREITYTAHGLQKSICVEHPRDFIGNLLEVYHSKVIYLTE